MGAAEIRALYDEALAGPGGVLREPDRPHALRRHPRARKGPVAVFASGKDVFFPARAVFPRAAEIFPNLALAERPGECQHIPDKAGLGRVNGRVMVFLSDSDGA